MIAGGGLCAPDASVARALLDRGATALISVGLCGGLDPALRVGAVVVPEAVMWRGKCYGADASLSARWGAMRGVLAGAETPVATAAAKARAFAGGACATDLETGVLAAVASAAGVPWAALRVVCDPAKRDLPRVVSVALDASGRLRPWAIAGALRPADIPALMRVASDAARARRALIGALRRAAC